MSLFQTMTWLIKMIHRPCCKQFLRGTIFFQPNYICQESHHAEGSVHLLMDKRLVLLTISMAFCSI